MKVNFYFKITCFTVNLEDNCYYKNGLPINKFNRKMLLYNMKNFNNIFNFKVYDYNHPLVKECKEKYKDFFNRKDIWNSIKADIVRLYILSKLPYHLYIDDDVVLLPTFNIKNTEEAFFDNISYFCCIYNGTNTDVFKEMLDSYPFEDEQVFFSEEARNNPFYNKNLYNLFRCDYYLFNNHHKFKQYIKKAKELEISHEKDLNFLNTFIYKHESEVAKIKNIYIYKNDINNIAIKEDEFYIILKEDIKKDYVNNVIYLSKKFYNYEDIIEIVKKTIKYKEEKNTENCIKLIL